MIVFDSMRGREREGEKEIIVREQVFFFIPTLWSFMNTGKNIEIKEGKYKKDGESWRSAKHSYCYEVAVNRPTIIFIFSCVHKFIQSEVRDVSLQLILVFLFISRRTAYYGAAKREKLWNDIIMMIIFS